MEVRRILLNTCALLGLGEDIVASPSSDEKTLSLLLSALNFVIYEIYDEIPTRTIEKITSQDKIIPYTAFLKNVSKVKSMRLDGIKGKWKRTDDGLRVERDGEWEIEYTYTPDDVGLDDEVVFPPSVNIRTVSYGVAGEYSLYVGRFEECSAYDARFVSALASAKRIGIREWSRGDGNVL